MAQDGDVAVRAEGRSERAIAGTLAARAARFGAAPPPAPEAMRRVLVWRIGGVRLAIPIEQVWAVAGAVRTTPVPDAPAALIGVFQRHGVIHSLFDPADALGIARTDAKPEDRHQIVIFRHDAPRIAIRVDAADGIVDVPARHWQDGTAAGQPIVDDAGPVGLVDGQELIGRLIGRPGQISEG